MTERSRTLLVLPFVLAWLVLGAVEKPTVLLGLVVVGMGLLGGAVLMVVRSNRPEPTTPPVRLPSGQRWIAVSWFLMLAVSEQRFTGGRSPLDANSGSISPEIALELLVYGVTTLLLFRHWQPARGTASTPRDVRPLFGWVFLAILSTSWSVVSLFSFVRGCEMLVLPLLAIHTARVIRMTDDGGRTVLRAVMRVFVIGLAFAVTTGWFTPWPYDGLRFAWHGTHPLVVSNLLGIGILTLAIAGREVLGFHRLTRMALLGYFLVTLVFTQPRTDYIALAFATITALWAAGRYRVEYRAFGLAYAGAGLAAFIVVVNTAIFNIGSHGTGGYETASTLDGRTTLWTLSLQQLHSVKDWLVGFGYGAPRVKIYNLVSWSGSAHSSPMELLLGIGMIGLILYLAYLGFVGYGLGSAKWSRHLDPRVQVLAITLFTFVAVHGVVSSELVVPSSSCTMLAFLASFVLARPSREPQHVDGAAVGAANPVLLSPW
ncbi:MAG TPA: O-antigen ligase family protein [Acidimicrobiales bacterium]|nr:O-antigen ligase family protein [Acidimicrobiales bacterium]